MAFVGVFIFAGIGEEVLKLSVVSRLSNGKGFERLLNLVKSLKANDIPFKFNDHSPCGIVSSILQKTYK